MRLVDTPGMWNTVLIARQSSAAEVEDTVFWMFSARVPVVACLLITLNFKHAVYIEDIKTHRIKKLQDSRVKTQLMR